MVKRFILEILLIFLYDIKDGKINYLNKKENMKKGLKILNTRSQIKKKLVEI